MPGDIYGFTSQIICANLRGKSGLQDKVEVKYNVSERLPQLFHL